MTLTTRCPQCRTLFRVTPAQLEARGGRVRCGRCMHVFNGREAAAGGESQVADATSHTEATGVAELAAVASPPPKSASSAPAASAGEATAPTAASAANAAQEPAEPIQARRERWRKPSPGAIRIAACVTLAVLLVAQGVYAFRSELSARYPVVKTTMTGLCNIAGCSVSLPVRPELVTLVAEDVNRIDPARPALIQLTATLRSTARYDVAYPALDLVLTNANEHALARRIFLPEEYLDETMDVRSGMPPNGEITIALDLDTGDLNAAGFRLALLPAP